MLGACGFHLALEKSCMCRKDNIVVKGQRNDGDKKECVSRQVRLQHIDS